MPKKKSKDTPAAQYQRFVETARALESDESGKSFEAVLNKIVPVKKKTRKTIRSTNSS